MKAICIENNSGNGNFTLNKIYEVLKNRITCDFIHIALDKDLKIENDEFEYARCKFRIIK